MMKKIIKALVYPLLFITFIIILLPREHVWYQVEEIVQTMDVTIDGESFNNSLTTLDIETGKLFYSELLVGIFEKIEITPMLVSNSVVITNLRAGNDMKMFKGLDIQEAVIKHSILAPLEATITASGSFGSLQGSVSTQGIQLDIKPSKLMLNNTTLRQQLKRTKEGYSYEKHF